MDKARNLMRRTSVFSGANKQKKLFGGGVVSTDSKRGNLKLSEKSKKQKVRSLSAMGYPVSEKEEVETSPSSNVTATSKRFKILNDSNGVHHASVPRKLRSAMKKRSHESMLLESENVSHKISRIESPKKDCIKKSKVRVNQETSQERSQGESVSGSITRDEEEVAEALYAMAGMFPDNGMNDSKELCGEPLPENSLVSEELKESAAETAQQASPCPEISPSETSKIGSSHETIGQEQLDLPLKVNSESSNKVALHDPELCLAMGSEVFSSCILKSLSLSMLKEQKENEGLTLWSGLSSVASSSSQACVQSSVTKAPGWLEAAICASKQDSTENRSSIGKTSRIATNKRSWKRCAAHVHITRMIRGLESPKRRVIEEPELHERHQTGAQEGPKHGVLLELMNLKGRMRNGVTSSSAPGTGQFRTVRNQNESKNGIVLRQQCHYSAMSQAAPTLGMHAPQKQGFNLLSLSDGRSNGSKVGNNNNSYYDKIGTRLEALSKLQVPYFQSLPHHHGLMSTIPQSQHAPSSSYLDHLSGPQIRLPQPQYYGGHYRSSSKVSSKQQQQQSFLAWQLAAQSRSSAINCNNIVRTPQYPNWQSGRHNEYASVEGLGSKKSTSISSVQQQQQIIASIHEKWARSSSPFCM